MIGAFAAVQGPILQLPGLTVRGDSTSVTIILILTLLTLLPALLLSMTPFVRILVIFHFLRQALGTQTTPTNQTLIGLALFVTVHDRDGLEVERGAPAHRQAPLGSQRAQPARRGGGARVEATTQSRERAAAVDDMQPSGRVREDRRDVVAGRPRSGASPREGLPTVRPASRWAWPPT